MDKDTMKQFVQALGAAYWGMTMPEFAAFLGIAADGYALEKFQALRQATEALGEFDLDNLTKLANYRKGEAEEKEKPMPETEPADVVLYECRDCGYEWHDPPPDGPDAPDCCLRCGSDNIEA